MKCKFSEIFEKFCRNIDMVSLLFNLFYNKISNLSCKLVINQYVLCECMHMM